MKKQLILICMVLSVLSYAQQSKRKVYKKPVKKTIKKSVPKSNSTSIPVVPEQAAETTPPLPEIVEPPKHEATAQRLQAKAGWIKNRNSSVVRGIEGYVKGVYVGEGKVYVLIEVANRTNINYDVESVSFITSPIQVKNRQIEAEEKVFTPVYAIQPESIAKKSNQKLVYVFDKFTIADNKNLMFIMTEVDGERTLSLDIKPKYIVGAEYVK
ncbi:DUF4138 domain-containing protein [Kaistella pullorum]|uniref:DUF4138 domain-containing protein n=1 Tax=Kaistella pullorum TaxID=2763074 RepID=A0ABR8WQA5_9FLAO|nr:DUF4138 domain-containing protein [Kaistella pullorum]MBD8019062.1 DUF4138 domain-containing protein [Kaistella pullorum]